MRSGEIIPERRRVRRLPVRVPVRCDGLGPDAATYTVNLTEGGTYLEARKSPAVEGPLELSLHLPDGGRPLELKGRVVRASRSPEEPAGVGVQFLAVDRAARERLVLFVEGTRSAAARW